MLATQIRSDDWLESLRRGDPAAWRILVARFTARLRARARSRIGACLRAKVDPDDVVQSVYRTLCRRLRTGRPQLRDTAQLFKLLLTLTADRCRRWHEHYHGADRDISREQPLGECAGVGGAATAETPPGAVVAIPSQIERALHVWGKEVRQKLDGVRDVQVP